MITISTGGIGPMDITAGTKSKGASKEEKAVDAFASLMNMVSTKQDNGDAIRNTDVDVTEVAPQKDVAKEYETYSKQQEVDASKDKLQNTENSVAKEDTEVSGSKELDDDGYTDDQITDKVVALVKQVKDTLKEKLGLSDEQIESLLADMGITAPELLVGDNLKAFVLQAEGATNVDLLVNEDLSNLVKNVTDEITNLILDSGFDSGFDVGTFINDNALVINEALEKIDINVDIVSDDVEINNYVNDNIDSLDTTVQLEQNVNSDVDNSIHVEDEASVDQTKDTSNQSDRMKTSDQTETVSRDNINVNHNNDSGQEMGHEHNFEQSNQQIQANLDQALNNVSNSNIDMTSFAGNITEADIIRQIIDQIKVNVGSKVQSMEVQLNPENLGKVYVNVEAKDGVMQAKIVAETEAAKNAIENNLAVLKENFSNNEIKVEAIEVMVAAYGFFEESQNGDFDNQEQTNDTSKAIGTLNVSDLNEDELTEEEVIEAEIMRTKGNTVSYTV